MDSSFKKMKSTERVAHVGEIEKEQGSYFLFIYFFLKKKKEKEEEEEEEE
jgi:hypothetical protein